MNKAAAIAKLRTKQHWPAGQVISIVNEIPTVDKTRMEVKRLGVGDYFFDPRTRHPSLIIRPANKHFMTIALTSSESDLVVAELNTRYVAKQNVYPGIHITDVAGMEKNYIGSVSPEEVKRVQKLVFAAFKSPNP